MHHLKSAARFYSMQQKTDEMYWNFHWNLLLLTKISAKNTQATVDVMQKILLISEKKIKNEASRFHVSVLLLNSRSLLILSPLHVVLVSTACCTGEGQGKSIFIKVAWQSLKTTGTCMTAIDAAPSRSGSLSPWWCRWRCALSWPLS